MLRMRHCVSEFMPCRVRETDSIDTTPIYHHHKLQKCLNFQWNACNLRADGNTPSPWRQSRSFRSEDPNAQTPQRSLLSAHAEKWRLMVATIQVRHRTTLQTPWQHWDIWTSIWHRLKRRLRALVLLNQREFFATQGLLTLSFEINTRQRRSTFWSLSKRYWW